MGMAIHKTKTKPNPNSAHNEPRDPSFHLVKITKQATRQTINVGSCINNIERNILIWSGVFINLDACHAAELVLAFGACTGACTGVCVAAFLTMRLGKRICQFLSKIIRATKTPPHPAALPRSALGPRCRPFRQELPALKLFAQGGHQERDLGRRRGLGLHRSFRPAFAYTIQFSGRILSPRLYTSLNHSNVCKRFSGTTTKEAASVAGGSCDFMTPNYFTPAR